MRSFLTVVAFSLAMVHARAEVVQVNYPDSKIVHLQYTKNTEGMKEGPFTENYPNGKVKAKGTYKADQLDGKLTHYHPSGAVLATTTYKAGVKDGEYKDFNTKGTPLTSATYKDGGLTGTLRLLGTGGFAMPIKPEGPAIPRLPGETLLNLSSIATIPNSLKKSDILANERLAALRRLQQYRAVAGVPFEGMTLDDDYNLKTQAAAKLLDKVGKLDHTPAKPNGYPDNEYKTGYEGTSHSNIYMGVTDLVRTVDGYMDDSDPTNIDRVGHRRWCLNPVMLKTGFGRATKFAAMWSFDDSRKDIPDFDTVCQPAAGFMPLEYFGERHAWSIQFNPEKYEKLENNVKVKVSVLTEKGGSPFKLDYEHINNDIIGVPNCVIFRPEKAGLVHGKRFVVEIEGVKTKDGKAATIKYLVAFIALGN